MKLWLVLLPSLAFVAISYAFSLIDSQNLREIRDEVNAQTNLLNRLKREDSRCKAKDDYPYDLANLAKVEGDMYLYTNFQGCCNKCAQKGKKKCAVFTFYKGGGVHNNKCYMFKTYNSSIYPKEFTNKYITGWPL